MTKEDPRGNHTDEGERKPFKVRLPGFISPEEDTGLGDVIKRATSLAGIEPCGSCKQRAAALNRRITFSGRRSP